LGWLESVPPKVYVGANMPQMLRMAGRVADGVMLSDLRGALASQAISTARSAAVEQGRNPADLWFSSFTAWHVYPDLEQARNEAKRWLLLRGLFRPWVLQEFLEQSDIDRIMNSQPAFVKAFAEGSHVIEGIPDALADVLVDKLSLTATPNTLEPLIEELSNYKEAGLSSVSLRLYEQPVASMQLLAKKVLPALR
jgi:alkanesulfonate monooxygenase SsuD/methylene tetrahydromethanopterin reductase-like flavin-dependent oxidoreductase (luciferase family)